MRDRKIGRKAGRAALLAAAVLGLSAIGVSVASAGTGDRGGVSNQDRPVEHSNNPFRDIDWM